MAPYTPAVFIGRDTIPVDEKIISTLEKDHLIDRSLVVENIQRNRFNDMTTTYYLLFKKKERAGIFRQQYNSEVKKLLSGILPKTNAEKLVASTGGSDSPTNPLRNFEKAKFASKTHGLITSYAANTHQGI